MKSPRFNLMSDMTASVSFADSSPLLQYAPKAAHIHHAGWPWTIQLRVILQSKLTQLSLFTVQEPSCTIPTALSTGRTFRHT